jgi:hypothetical protein
MFRHLRAGETVREQRPSSQQSLLYFRVGIMITVLDTQVGIHAILNDTGLILEFWDTAVTTIIYL